MTLLSLLQKRQELTLRGKILLRPPQQNKQDLTLVLLSVQILLLHPQQNRQDLTLVAKAQGRFCCSSPCRIGKN